MSELNSDDRPCPYCWQPEPGWEDRYMDTGVLEMPPEGFAPIHPECQRSVDLYIEEQARNPM